ncbi:type I-E CRISPR-associated protein Cse2/CasB [Streptomyces sp. NPDC048508]|uniref:type I-E CRISPR-associated protein Cse2/CasB n=1 Tax=Streptomyces sp. NPDC048508 TaxID=3365561 RepID=UPI00371EC209
MTSPPTAPPSNRQALYRKYVDAMTQRCGTDPGVRVALRKGLRRGLNDVAPLHRIVAAWLPEQRSDDEERAFYAVAAMIADRPRHTFNASNDGALPTDEETSSTSTADELDTARNQEPAAVQNQPPLARGRRDSLGASFARAVTSHAGQSAVREDTAEARLNLLTRQSMDGLHRHLPGSVRLLRGSDTDIDYAVLLADLVAWPQHSKAISRRWLQDFYRVKNAAREAAARHRDSEEEQTDTAN